MAIKRNGKRQDRKEDAGPGKWQTRVLTPEQIAARAALPRLTEEEAAQRKANNQAVLESLDRLAQEIYDRGGRLQVSDILDEAREGLP